jgi:hypothetical protein
MNVKLYYDTLLAINEHFKDSPINRLEVILILLPLRYDLSKIKNPSYMERLEWVATLSNIIEILHTIRNSKESSLNKLRTFNKDGEEFYSINLIYDVLVS